MPLLQNTRLMHIIHYPISWKSNTIEVWNNNNTIHSIPCFGVRMQLHTHTHITKMVEVWTMDHIHKLSKDVNNGSPNTIGREPSSNINLQSKHVILLIQSITFN